MFQSLERLEFKGKGHMIYGFRFATEELGILEEIRDKGEGCRVWVEEYRAYGFKG